MDFNILVKAIDDGFIATVTPALPDCTVKAATREEAIEQVRKEARAWLENSEIIPLGMLPRRSLLNFVGIWKDDEMWEAFQEELRKNRAADIAAVNADLLAEETGMEAQQIPALSYNDGTLSA